MPMTIYFAGPLFSEAERFWIDITRKRIEVLAAELKKDVRVIWPWELFSPGELELLGPCATEKIQERCLLALDRSDLLIALLDGTQVDDGTAFEIGYFYHATRDKKQIIGVRTDLRKGGECVCAGSCVNAMVEAACGRIARSSDEAISFVEAFLNRP